MKASNNEVDASPAKDLTGTYDDFSLFSLPRSSKFIEELIKMTITLQNAKPNPFNSLIKKV
jgi:hypothetical protein